MSDHQPETTHSRQDAIFTSIKSIFRNIKKEKAANKTKEFFEVHTRNLEALWAEYCSNHERLKSEGKIKDEDFGKGMYEQVSSSYKTTSDALKRMYHYYKIAKFPEAENSQNMPESVADIETNPVKLLENDVPMIADSADAVINLEENVGGVEFMSVEMLLNELTAQTAADGEQKNSAQKTQKRKTRQSTKCPTKSKRAKTNEESEFIVPKTENDCYLLEVLDATSDKSMKCPYEGCETHFTQKRSLSEHLKRHSLDNPFKCKTCGYSAYNKTRFQEHINTHAGIKPYKCKHCEYSSVSKKYVKMHETKHGVCECGFVSKNKSKLKAHKDESCPLTNAHILCKKCNKRFITPDDLERHKSRSGTCDTECTEFHCELISHTRKEHNEKSFKIYRFVCSECGWKGGNEQKVLFHLIHHPQEVDENIDVSILRKYGIL